MFKSAWDSCFPISSARKMAVLLLLVLLKVNGSLPPANVTITILDSAVAKGAVCLDGSAPAYHLDKGSGVGVNNWLVHLQGGAWCNNIANCKIRSKSKLGSSKLMDTSNVFDGLLHNSSEFNPEFFNWNRILVMYCDGASFTGDVEEVDPVANLFFRGSRIFKAVVDELLAEGMKDAQKVVLSGCSAGGLAAILNCDRFKAMLPSSTTTVKCIADAGYFVHIRDVAGNPRIETYYDEVVRLHGSAKNLPESCTSKMKPSLCFFPQYVAGQIQTPIFFVNAGYDLWQISVNYAPDSLDPRGLWTACKNDLSNCSADQMKAIQHFNVEFLNAFQQAITSTSRIGYFINGCYTHCQTERKELWSEAGSPKLGGKTIAKAVGDWVYDLGSFGVYGRPYPYDKTCQNYVNHTRY